MILTSECEKCIYGFIDESNKPKIKVKCELKGKKYHYGQCIPCEDKKKRKEATNE